MVPITKNLNTNVSNAFLKCCYDQFLLFLQKTSFIYFPSQDKKQNKTLLLFANNKKTKSLSEKHPGNVVQVVN